MQGLYQALLKANNILMQIDTLIVVMYLPIVHYFISRLYQNSDLTYTGIIVSFESMQT